MAPIQIYLAGPDVFLRDALDHARAKIAICARYGLVGHAPAEAAPLPNDDAWRGIFLADLAMMEACDAIIANLTPFRGASADAGTLVELGWFLGRGRKLFGYSNSALLFPARSAAQRQAVPDPLPGLAEESFGLADNLMIPGAVEHDSGLPITLPPDGLSRPFDALDIFEICVAQAASALRS
ncbi:MAG TPA: nucleoside 2-deoxyribosyltransferase [Acidocella sp.]|uniref:nucleoside 2-deoxyribosyltransferase n=1 Tax=Acidocella sp. TaxID=50710 RepID=UPI002CE03FF7|nr:nucleoside 2-deoxyribosyltransferase [Acidocella sp.]HVE23183.1 nucleoside 2-deoxyribosyltransferase [Acidocella sp.]